MTDREDHPPTSETREVSDGPPPKRRTDRLDIGPYRVIQKIGEGGMGEVYEAEQREPIRRRLALKVIKRGMETKQVLARFEAERQALALMDHPCVAKVFDAGETEDGRPYFAMEYVVGVSITEHCDTHRLTTDERLRLFTQVCDGVQHAHQKAVIHRDIKPSNVLVTIQGEKTIPKIIDFGVAKATAQPLTERTLFTEMGQLIGTPAYMSPEQAEMTGLNVDTRTDVYSLGAVLYELLVGAQPFDSKQLRGAGVERIRQTLREVEPPRPSTRVTSLGERSTTSAGCRRTTPRNLSSQLRGDLDWITMKALDKDRTRRYASPSELSADIERHLRNEPVVAGPPSVRYRASKFVLRHRVGVTIGGLLGALLIAFAAREKVMSNRVAAERDRAALEAETAQQVSEFLIELFEVSDPSEARGNSITAREVLDRGATKIDEDLGDRPEVRARMMMTMGTVYKSLGLFEPATPLLEQAQETLHRVAGEDDPTTLRAMNDLADLYDAQGRYEEAADLQSQTLKARSRVLGGEHPETLVSMSSLGLIYAEQGRYDEAESLLVRAREVQRRVLGEEHDETLTTVNNLGGMYYTVGRLEEAESLWRETLEITRRIHGEEHPDALGALNNLASLLARLGRYEEAEPLLRQCLEARRRVLGDEHPETLNTSINLAEVYVNRGRYEEAEVLFRRTLEMAPPAVGEAHKYTMNAMSGLSGLCKKQRRYEEAEELDRRALELSRRALGDEHPSTLRCLGNLALLLDLQGRNEEAESLYLQNLEIQRRVLGEEHPSVLASMSNLAGFYRDAGRYEESEALYVAALAGKRRVRGDEHPSTLKTTTGLARLYQAQGRYTEAEKLFLETMEARRRVLGEEHPDTNESRRDLASLMLRRDRIDEAIAWLDGAVEHGDADLSAFEQPDFARLRDHPGFEALMKRVKARSESE